MQNNWNGQEYTPAVPQGRIMKSKKLLIFILLTTLFLTILPASQPALAQGESLVHAVLFYSPTCGHCEKVIKDVLPPLQGQFGEQLQIAQIDVTKDEGQALYQLALQQFNVSDDRVGVPALIVGENYLVGDVEIPEQLPKIIAAGIASGGIEWPALDGLSRFTQEEPPPDPTALERMIAKFNRDRAGNTMAIVTLIIMILSVIGVAISYARGIREGERSWPEWVVPVLAVLGLFVSFYLSFVEVTKSQALCGPIGDCNTVQQSPYAHLFGVLPVGILGLLGYVAILAVWGLRIYARRSGAEKLERYSALALWGFAWFGVLFSIYLTFLEPFVIGATCAWCISQALIITLMLWATTGPAKHAMEIDDDFEDDELEEEASPS